jgi:serine/threonine protein kinase
MTQYDLRDDSETSTFVLKTCLAKNVHHHHDEVEAYKAMGAEEVALPNMIRFYGSWRQGDTYNMLLEYVGGGTLESFMEATDPPTRFEDILKFWVKLFDLVALLARIHRHPNPNHRHTCLQG